MCLLFDLVMGYNRSAFAMNERIIVVADDK